jgi:hypothetical protein
VPNSNTLKDFAELKLTSVVTRTIGQCLEAWLYDTKKRKLIHIMADSHIGTFSVKGSAVVGFDTNTDCAKNST